MALRSICVTIFSAALVAAAPQRDTIIGVDGVGTVITGAETSSFTRGGGLTSGGFGGSGGGFGGFSSGSVGGFGGGAGNFDIASAAVKTGGAGFPAGKQFATFGAAETKEAPTVIAVKVEPSPIVFVDSSAQRTEVESFSQQESRQEVAGAGAGLGGFPGGAAGGYGVGAGAGVAVAGAWILKKLLVLKALIVGAAIIG